MSVTQVLQWVLVLRERSCLASVARWLRSSAGWIFSASWCWRSPQEMQVAITRDLLIGGTPPAAIADWKYLGVSMLAGFVVFFWYPLLARLSNPVLWSDAISSAFFAVAGAQKALVYGFNPIIAALLGMLTGIGGGTAPDVLVNQIPTVLRADLCALQPSPGRL